MRLCFISLLIIVSSCGSHAQTTPVAADSIEVNPGTVVLIAKIRSVQNETVRITVTQVVSTGQGIVNVPSNGQEIEVRLADKNIRLNAGDMVRTSLKEKLGVDASQSSFILLNAVKQ